MKRIKKSFVYFNDDCKSLRYSTNWLVPVSQRVVYRIFSIRQSNDFEYLVPVRLQKSLINILFMSDKNNLKRFNIKLTVGSKVHISGIPNDLYFFRLKTNTINSLNAFLELLE